MGRIFQSPSRQFHWIISDPSILKEKNASSFIFFSIPCMILYTVTMFAPSCLFSKLHSQTFQPFLVSLFIFYICYHTVGLHGRRGSDKICDEKPSLCVLVYNVTMQIWKGRAFCCFSLIVVRDHTNICFFLSTRD